MKYYVNGYECPKCNDRKIDIHNNMNGICPECGSKMFIWKENIEIDTERGERLRKESEEKNRIYNEKKKQGAVTCPKCGSTSITSGQRGYSLLTGFIGSGSTVNRCGNCGYKWKPGR